MMARRRYDDTLRDEFRHQLKGFPREFKRQVGGFGREATQQLGSGWGDEFAGQLFGARTRRYRRGR